MNLPNNKEFYSQSIKEHGISAEGVRWNNKYSQYKRFEAITKRIKKEIHTSTILDVGCGFGEYIEYLKINNKTPYKYIGIDCEQDMINICKKRFPNEEFHLIDVLKDDIPYSDYTVCSGALSILKYNQVEQFIATSFKHSKKGFIFNSLKDLTFNNIKQYEIVDICKKYAQKISVYEGYLDNDFTILMVK
ncbi:class I SAM-dependent methyltransferase [Arcobacteraceae bacterium]|nr:class I SAM-dependent methyltransferase [Arcobacteraceae bacterium]